MDEKVDKYFNLLHPEAEIEKMSEEEYKRALEDKAFIGDHINEIDEYYEDCMREGSGAQHMGLTEQKIIANALRVVKVDKYFKLLHPEYDTLTPGEQFKLVSEQRFIMDHINEIDEYYEDCMKEGSGAQHMGLTEQKIIANALRVVKVDKYFKLLHPEYDTLTPGEQFKLVSEQRFIMDYIDEIDEYYEDCMKEGSGAQHEEMTEQQIMQKILDKLKTKQIMPKQIEQATINVSTIAKKKAEQVEVGENVREEKKGRN